MDIHYAAPHPLPGGKKKRVKKNNNKWKEKHFHFAFILKTKWKCNAKWFFWLLVQRRKKKNPDPTLMQKWKKWIWEENCSYFLFKKKMKSKWKSSVKFTGRRHIDIIIDGRRNYLLFVRYPFFLARPSEIPNEWKRKVFEKKKKTNRGSIFFSSTAEKLVEPSNPRCHGDAPHFFLRYTL